MNKSKKPENKKIITSKLPQINKMYLLGFLSLIFFVFLLLFVTELFNDLGWWDGRFHINYYYDPAKSGNHPSYLDPYYDTPRGDWGLFGLSDKDPLWLKWNTRITRQPNLFWSFTQFTWLTTYIVFATVIVRLLKFQSRWPKALKWIISHDTLLLVTVLDTVVMVVFWSALFKNFQTNFSPDIVLKILRMTVTILVHSVIPIALLIYTSVFAIQDQEVTIMDKRFIVAGNLVFLSYIGFYILMAFTWDDPYAPFTILRSGVGWWSLVGLACVMEFVVIFSFYFNNFIIKRFNKYYRNNQTHYQISKRKELGLLAKKKRKRKK
jgi:hypothetical protein